MEHRSRVCGRKKGVLYYNDSKNKSDAAIKEDWAVNRLRSRKYDEIPYDDEWIKALGK